MTEARVGAGPALVALVTALALTGCASTSARTRSAPPAPTAPAGTASGPTTVATVPTVFNCGGGAYEPATLVVVCGVATTTVTGATWSSWNAAGATGTGSVNLAGRAWPARLAVDTVLQTPGGPQFARLVVTWTAGSPDGNPTATYRLAVATAPGT